MKRSLLGQDSRPQLTLWRAKLSFRILRIEVYVQIVRQGRDITSPVIRLIRKLCCRSILAVTLSRSTLRIADFATTGTMCQNNFMPTPSELVQILLNLCAVGVRAVQGKGSIFIGGYQHSSCLPGALRNELDPVKFSVRQTGAIRRQTECTEAGSILFENSSHFLRFLVVSRSARESFEQALGISNHADQQDQRSVDDQGWCCALIVKKRMYPMCGFACGVHDGAVEQVRGVRPARSFSDVEQEEFNIIP